MHCSADLTEDRDAADADGDWTWDAAEAGADGPVKSPTSAGESDGIGRGDSPTDGPSSGARAAEPMLDPAGLVDDSLTVVVGILAGVVVGIIGTFVMGVVTGSAWALLFGLVAWLGATAYLVRRRTVQEAIAKGAYGLAIVLLSVPIIALSPVTDVQGGIAGRGGLFVGLLLFVAIPAVIAAAVGKFAARYVPAEDGGSEG
jgi:hypothetical protein